MKIKTIIKKSIPWIALGIALLALIITLLVLFNVISPKEHPVDNHNDILGVLISSVALVVSLFFVILGVRASQIQKQIEEEAAKFESVVNKHLTTPATHISETFYLLYSRAIEILSIMYNNLPQNSAQTIDKDYLDKLKIAQARFACNAEYIDKKTKITGINLLRAKSHDLSDLELLNHVISNPQNDNEIRDIASKAYIEIKKRLEK